MIDQRWKKIGDGAYCVPTQRNNRKRSTPIKYYNECLKKGVANAVDINKAEESFWDFAEASCKNPEIVQAYAADNYASLFENTCKHWNFKNMNSFLLDIFNQGDNFFFEGVTSSFVYFGAAYTGFAWHREDEVIYK